ncbi:hypothetical protein BO78DRAFT_466973 [Aspergillus sclerotiicarbonarius CBS 121057]|uniref:Uncharacterized protein n=1 Tax=Aspergillus sclerotiicarbonarius (strain CBS 121057 / IBT 28362) TaxID=1448318 RepID=A0A319EKS5_ASPSB|nr:hypothetical protein BO78DRAFT_466973 [Aspergillus sclerotiicarbonarius CBS 121057]
MIIRIVAASSWPVKLRYRSRIISLCQPASQLAASETTRIPSSSTQAPELLGSISANRGGGMFGLHKHRTLQRTKGDWEILPVKCQFLYAPWGLRGFETWKPTPYPILPQLGAGAGGNFHSECWFAAGAPENSDDRAVQALALAELNRTPFTSGNKQDPIDPPWLAARGYFAFSNIFGRISLCDEACYCSGQTEKAVSN